MLQHCLLGLYIVLQIMVPIWNEEDDAYIARRVVQVLVWVLFLIWYTGGGK